MTAPLLGIELRANILIHSLWQGTLPSALSNEVPSCYWVSDGFTDKIRNIFISFLWAVNIYFQGTLCSLSSNHSTLNNILWRQSISTMNNHVLSTVNEIITPHTISVITFSSYVKWMSFGWRDTLHQQQKYFFNLGHILVVLIIMPGQSDNLFTFFLLDILDTARDT